MFSIRWPWTKRADNEERLRRDAEYRRYEVEQDWHEIKKSTDAITEETKLNDWTRTAIVIFRGKHVGAK